MTRDLQLDETAVGVDAQLADTAISGAGTALADTTASGGGTALADTAASGGGTELADTAASDGPASSLGASLSPAGERWLRVARLTLLSLSAAAVANIGYFIARFVVASDPPLLHSAFRGVAAGGREAAELGGTLAALGGVQSTLVRLLLVSVLLLLIPLAITRRHRSNPLVQGLGAVALMSGQFSLAVAVLTSSETVPVWRGLAVFFYVALPASGLAVLTLFPTGKPVPRWALWTLPLAVAPFAAQAFYMLLHRGYSMPLSVGCMSSAALYLGFVWHRYRTGASLRQRNQIKWLAYGGAAFIGIQAVAIVGVLPRLGHGGGEASALWKLLYEVLLGASYLVGMTIALLSAARYRLWDIDRIVNRTLLYGVLTVVLLAVMLVAYFGLQLGLESITTAASETSSIISLLVAVVVAGPIRRRVARWIDRRIYGIGIDYQGLARRAVRQTLPTDGPRFAAYDELELLGRGGMGAVYRAHHPDYKMPVALKVMSPELGSDADARARFRREASILEGLRHPNVVPFLASGHEQGLEFIAMAFVQGEDLGALLRRRGRLTLDEVVAMLDGVARALDAAHALAIVHRDVKPANILVEGTDDEALVARTPMLMDFGVARWDEQDARGGGTGVIGSLPYVAPEQIREASAVDGRADIYALGVTAYELLTGTLPFRDKNALGLVMAHLNRPPPDPRLLVPELPPHSAAAVLEALAKDPTRRFATAGAFVDALRGSPG